MLNWGHKKLRSDRELAQVRMHVITQPAGLLGRFFGRCLRLRVDQFSYTVGPGNRLQQVDVEADSLVPDCEVRRVPVPESQRMQIITTDSSVHSSKADLEAAAAMAASRFEERVPLTISESSKLVRRARGYVLDVPRYPYVQFDVEAEDPAGITGTLHLHGESHQIKCHKAVEGTELAVRCPVSLKQFGIVPFTLWVGLFGVADTVLVETRVPATALKL